MIDVALSCFLLALYIVAVVAASIGIGMAFAYVETVAPIAVPLIGFVAVYWIAYKVATSYSRPDKEI